MASDIVVLGAGMVGVCTALHLARRGHRVVLVDRREPGRETSYGNAGLIQREAIEPYPFPREVRTLLRVALRQGFDIHYHWRALPAVLPRLAGYWIASGRARYPRIAREYGSLIEHCIAEHDALIEAAGCRELVRPTGFRTVFRKSASMRLAADKARRLADAGVQSVVESADELARAEPALRMRAAGAVHWLQPWSVVDPGELVAQYAGLFTAAGGTLARGDARTLARDGAGWSVRTEAGAVSAEHVVVALGPWAEQVTVPLGYRLPLFIKRGYHRHYRCEPTLSMPLQDADCGFVLSPMARGMRLATGAEFAGIDAPATPVQLGRAEAAARQWIELAEPLDATPWLGARPCTTDMKPVIGQAPRHAGLWFNFGHAHQGFTLGPVSGRLLAELMDGEPTVVDAAPYSPARFGS